MKRMKPIRLAMFALSLVFILSLASTCFAYKVKPPIMYLTIPRGKAEIIPLYLLGDTFNEEVLMFKTDIIIDRKGNYRFEKIEGWKYSALDWIKLYKAVEVKEKTEEGKVRTRVITPLYKEREILTLNTTKYKVIGIKVKVPYNTKPGQYYAGIEIQPTEPTLVVEGKIKGKNVLIEYLGIMDIPIIITVPGRVPRLNGKVISAGADIKKEEVKILATFENTSGVIEFVKGEARIVNKEDKRVYDVVTMKALNPISPDGTGEIYPESLRDFEGVVSRPLPVGEYESRVAFDYGLGIRKARARTDFFVTQEIAASQKELLTLAVASELLEFGLKPGGMVMEGLEVIDQDFRPLRVTISTLPEEISWLKVTRTEVNLRAGQGRKIRVRIRIPRGEKVDRNAKIVLTPERGKVVVVDVIVKPEQGGEE